jgi:hypothetical protein
MILRGNDYWWDQGGSGNARYEIPKLDDPTAPKKHSLFAGSVWVGGIDANGLLKIAAQTYRQATVLGAGWWAGPLSLVDATITNDQCKIWDKHWKLNRRQHHQGSWSGSCTVKRRKETRLRSTSSGRFHRLRYP